MEEMAPTATPRTQPSRSHIYSHFPDSDSKFAVRSIRVIYFFFQRNASNVAKDLLVKSIQRNIVLPTADEGSRTFRIADLGCSVGPNTVASVQTIVGALEAKYMAEGLLRPETTPDFQVFFNDQEGTDFNTLFRILPPDRSYTVAGVPGSFHGKLFPRASMDVMHTSEALHWLGKVPDEVKRPGSMAWNKGKITFCDSASEVVEAFGVQFQRDIENFFEQRSMEMVEGGLLVILMPCRPDGTKPSEALMLQYLEDLVGHLLVDMTKEGLVDETFIDSFNLPMFIPTAAEVIEVASKIKRLSIEVVEKVVIPRDITADKLNRTHQQYSGMIRAVFEDLLVKHFGPAVADLLFSRLPRKIEVKSSESPPPAYFWDSEKYEHLFVLLKKK